MLASGGASTRRHTLWHWRGWPIVLPSGTMPDGAIRCGICAAASVFSTAAARTSSTRNTVGTSSTARCSSYSSLHNRWCFGDRTMWKRASCLGFALACSAIFVVAQTNLRLNDKEYFEAPGVNVMAFQDIYPDGHQGGVSIIQNGVRVATNGDLRLDPAPGQWQPMPKQDGRIVDVKENTITTTLSYPDPSKNRTGFNPINYPDLNFSYKVIVRGEGESIRVAVDLDKPIPPPFIGKVGFNFELFPNDLFGKTWFLGDTQGIFPRQANGPEQYDQTGEVQPVPLAAGVRLSIAPETEAQRMIIESKTGDLQLLDARSKRNNGWFVVRSLVKAGATKGAIEWVITLHAIPGWKYNPVVHVSQV